MNDMLLDMGTRALANLPTRAVAIQELMQKFNKTTLDELQTQFEALVASSPGSVNAEVVDLSALVREQAALAIEDIKSLEMYLAIKTPEVSDGNNFGVEVQSFVLGELKAVRAELVPMLGAISDYHGARAAVLEKVVRPVIKTVDEEAKTEKEGDKTTVKSSKTEKTSSKDEPPLADYVKQLAALDVKEYHASYLKLTDMRNAYFKTHLLMSKNKKRLADPRGDGEGARSNAMSMF